MPEKNKRDRSKRCRHFNGLMRKICQAGVEYGSHEKIADCYGERNGCENYSPLTATEIEEQMKQQARLLDLIAQGLSACCEAPLDTSQVITSGRHKGHGPRFCSNCGKLIFLV